MYSQVEGTHAFFQVVFSLPHVSEPVTSRYTSSHNTRNLHVVSREELIWSQIALSLRALLSAHHLPFDFLLPRLPVLRQANKKPAARALLVQQRATTSRMRFPTQILVSTGMAILTVGWANSQENPGIQSFVDFCAYRGVNLTDGHWLGAYCRNSMTDSFGYNYTWYAPSLTAVRSYRCRRLCD